MKKLIVASAAVVAMSMAPVLAQDNDSAAGGAAGGITGAITGGLIFGPIGAAIGGFTGAVIGSEVVDDDSVEFVRLHPTQPVDIQGDAELEVGFVIPEEITLHPIEGEDDVGYFYTNDRVYFVDLDTREVLFSPGQVVAEVEVE